MDAAGDSTHDAHKYGIKRMLQAGVIPVAVESLVSEWMHDWGNPKDGELVKDVYYRYWLHERVPVAGLRLESDTLSYLKCYEH